MPGEHDVYTNIVRLHDQHDWPGLVQTCSAEIQKTPEWLTPYMFRGAGYANLGRIDEAREDLKHVVNEAGDDPQFQEARQLLTKLPNE